MLESAGFEITFNPTGKTLSHEETIAFLDGKAALIAGTEKLSEEVFIKNPTLKYICRLGVGMDSVDMEAAKRHNIKVENTPSAHVDGVAELALAGLLAHLRNVARSDREIRNGNWNKMNGSLLRGKNVGLIGFGQVAKAFCKLLAPFDTKIFAVDPFARPEDASNLNVSLTSMEEVLSVADILSVHVPYSKNNHHLLNAENLKHCKKEILIINTARGGLIDEDALYNFLKENPKAGAYLDTFEQEPYHGPLAQLEQVTMTPHVGSYAKEVRLNMEVETAEKTIRFFKENG